MYTYTIPIRFRHTDAAGIIYFTEVLELCAESYERWMQSIGFPLAQILKENKILIPIVHCETDIHHPITLGDQITISLIVKRKGQKSYTIAYTLSNQDAQHVASAETVHVTIDAKTRKSIYLPEELPIPSAVTS